MKRKYSPDEGVALASIVARGTEKGTFQGLGVGVGTNGLGGGLVGGISSSQTKLAEELEFNIKPIERNGDFTVFIILFGVAMICGILPNIFDKDSLPWAFGVTVLLGVLAVITYLYAFQGKSNDDIQKENRELREEYRKKKDIYMRLRFVEKDFVIFDPVSGKWAYAENQSVKKLINAIYYANTGNH